MTVTNETVAGWPGTPTGVGTGAAITNVGADPFTGDFDGTYTQVEVSGEAGLILVPATTLDLAHLSLLQLRASGWATDGVTDDFAASGTVTCQLYDGTTPIGTMQSTNNVSGSNSSVFYVDKDTDPDLLVLVATAWLGGTLGAAFGSTLVNSPGVSYIFERAQFYAESDDTYTPPSEEEEPDPDTVEQAVWDGVEDGTDVPADQTGNL